MTNTTSPIGGGGLFAALLYSIEGRPAMPLTTEQWERWEALRTKPDVVLAMQDEIESLRKALEPFARIAELVEHTPQRDGETVFRLPKPDGGYWTLVRDDFRRARATFK